jgi:hypothetical protein
VLTLRREELSSGLPVCGICREPEGPLGAAVNKVASEITAMIMMDFLIVASFPVWPYFI